MRRIWSQKSTSYKEAEDFDDRFWRRAGASKRFEASWMMLMELYKIRGSRRGQLRLRRSVQNIKRV